MKVSAPGKLILSGEHAVVYGKPALAFAIDAYATTTLVLEESAEFKLTLADLGESHRFHYEELLQLAQSIQNKYIRFQQGEINIRDVLSQPHRLAIFALAMSLKNIGIKAYSGMHIDVSSSLPIGAGAGSSAAIIISLMYAIPQFFKKSLNQNQIFQMALNAENMQHGVSSGLDINISLHGGCFYYKKGHMAMRQPPMLPMYRVETGKPDTTTGECIAAAARYFANSSLATDFEAVTDSLDKLLLSSYTVNDVKKLIRINHELLVMIGVVPVKIQQFVKEIEAINSAAKICGAGAICGDQAGTVLVISEDFAALQTLCARYHYAVTPVKVAMRGVYVV